MPKPTLVVPTTGSGVTDNAPVENPFPPDQPVATSPARVVTAMRGSWLSRDIKEAIISGAAAYGKDGKGEGGMPGYLEMCAAEFPKEYMGLLARLVPLQVRGQAEGSAGINIGSVNIHPVASDRYLTAQEMRAMLTPVIENQPAEPEPELPLDQPTQPDDPPKAG